MSLRKPLALLVVIMIAGAGVIAGAQAKKKARAFFIEPKNGATVGTTVHMKFGSEGIEIAAVPPGDVTTTRPGVGHYHVGIGVSCLRAGKTIVKGTPSWVHFGDGKSEIDMQLTPGRHRLALQVADDLHNAIAGTCQMITVTAK